MPEEHKARLAQDLAGQLGRGDRDVQLSLSRALVALGADLVEPLLQLAMASEVPAVRAHATATARLLTDPSAGAEFAIHEARRQFRLKDRPA